MLSEQLLRTIADERDRTMRARIRVHGLLGGRRHPSRPHAHTELDGPQRPAGGGVR